jgi:hypothetical protein
VVELTNQGECLAQINNLLVVYLADLHNIGYPRFTVDAFPHDTVAPLPYLFLQLEVLLKRFFVAG